MPELFDKHGGFRRLHSFTLATIVQLETLRFCRRFLTHDHREADDKFYDPKGRQYDQMTQAARSGRQNIIEGSERSSTSKDTEMKLTDVARASLSELRGDYEMFILDRGRVAVVGPFGGGEGGECHLFGRGGVFRRHGA
jgi:restriction system protein